MENNALLWLQNWFLYNCDGDWEHENTINIESLANPGWQVKIYLNYTSVASIEIDAIKINNGDDDWFFYEIKNKVYRAGGDPKKLEFLILKFKEIVETNGNKT